MRIEWVAVPAAVLLLAPAAHAAEPGLELSRDGRTWSSTLTGPLLDEDDRLAPGGVTRSDVWVRNTSGRTVTMTALVRESGTTLPPEVSPRDDFRANVAGTTVTGAQLTGCHVVARQRLEPRERQRLPVAVRLPATSRNVSQGESLTLSLRVQFVVGESVDPCSSGPGGSKASAGSSAGAASPPERPGRVATGDGPLERPLVTDVLALGLLAAVLSVLGRRRRARTPGWGLSRRGPGPRGPRAS